MEIGSLTVYTIFTRNSIFTICSLQSVQSILPLFSNQSILGSIYLSGPHAAPPFIASYVLIILVPPDVFKCIYAAVAMQQI